MYKIIVFPLHDLILKVHLTNRPHMTHISIFSGKVIDLDSSQTLSLPS